MLTLLLSSKHVKHLALMLIEHGPAIHAYSWAVRVPPCRPIASGLVRVRVRWQQCRPAAGTVGVRSPRPLALHPPVTVVCPLDPMRPQVLAPLPGPPARHAAAAALEAPPKAEACSDESRTGAQAQAREHADADQREQRGPGGVGAGQG